MTAARIRSLPRRIIEDITDRYGLNYRTGASMVREVIQGLQEQVQKGKLRPCTMCDQLGVIWSTDPAGSRSHINCPLCDGLTVIPTPIDTT